MKKTSGRYPPREAFATRPPPEMAEEGGDVGEITGLDRPRFVEDVDLGVPHTRERPSDSALAAPDSPDPAPSAGLLWPKRLWVVVLAVALFTGVAGTAFGFLLATGS